ncbi:hypothetical protein BT96DRAFT_945854 [Gymnopus androsaceus JB14]|uniref:Uncharacterized protein n=1 Tax=Gymnopus androsaceus JB14 TaxID=1447944 RepID=A0A6A4GZB5_9AGAR|nr:hypothetical protein BT96DRAFT_945854 [Gymnopus androsaceus JB14]
MPRACSSPPNLSSVCSCFKSWLFNHLAFPLRPPQDCSHTPSPFFTAPATAKLPSWAHANGHPQFCPKDTSLAPGLDGGCRRARVPSISKTEANAFTVAYSYQVILKNTVYFLRSLRSTIGVKKAPREFNFVAFIHCTVKACVNVWLEEILALTSARREARIVDSGPNLSPQPTIHYYSSRTPFRESSLSGQLFYGRNLLYPWAKTTRTTAYECLIFKRTAGDGKTPYPIIDRVGRIVAVLAGQPEGNYAEDILPFKFLFELFVSQK